MGNAIYESVVARLSLLVPLLSRTQVDIGLSKLGTDPFHVTAVQMAQALTRFILPRIQEITQKTPSLDVSNVAQLVTDENRSLVRISPNLSLITGVQYSDGAKFKELLDSIVPSLNEFDQSDLALREVTIGGRTLLVSSSLERDEKGKPMRVVSHLSDQTLRLKLWSEVSRIHDELELQVERRTSELRASEESLRRKEAHIRAIIESLPVVVYERLPDGAVSYISPNLSSLWGYRPEEFREDPDFWVSRIHPEHRADFRLRSDQGASQEYRFFSRRKNDYVWVQDVSRGERNSEGRILRYFGIMADITQQKELQEQVFHSQKMETMGMLAAGFAHDFLNQLTEVMTNVELIENKSGPDTPYKNEIEDALDAVRSCSELVRSMLAFGRGDITGAVTTCRPNRIVEELVELLRHAISREIQIKVITNPQVWDVRADQTQILQVLMNLSLNARDAMPEGGTLMIETDNYMIDAAYCGRVLDAQPGRYVMISVGDTGLGIPQELLPRIFEPFFSTKHSGKNFGMGLVSSRGIVKAHRGWIEVLSNPDEGSNFRVFLPRVQKAGDANTVKDASGATLLVMDESESIRKMSRKVLEEAGFQVLLAEDASEALRLFYEHTNQISAAILDLDNSGKTVLQLYQEIQRKKSGMRILLTAGFREEDASSELAAKGVRMLYKPFTATDLIDAVRKLTI